LISIFIFQINPHNRGQVQGESKISVENQTIAAEMPGFGGSSISTDDDR